MINRRILLGKCVVCSANILGQAVEVFIFLIFCGFEHHVFEQVREARTARGGALMVLNGKDRQPVGQSELPIFQRRDFQRCRRGLRLPVRWGITRATPITALIKTARTNQRNKGSVFMFGLLSGNRLSARPIA